MTLLFFTAAFFSEVLGTIAGFGSSVIFLPLALLFVDFHSALVLVAFLHIFGNISRLGLFTLKLDRSVLITFGLSSVVFTYLGASLVTQFDPNILKGLLGIFLVTFALYELIKDKNPVKLGQVTTAIGGGLSGFTAGLIGTGGPVRAAFLTHIAKNHTEYIATASILALLVDLTRIPIYVTQGFLRTEYYWYIPVLFVVALSGSWLGKTLMKNIPHKHYREIVLISILLFGIKSIVG